MAMGLDDGRGPRAASRGAVLEIRLLDGDLAASEREEVAALDLHLLAVGRRAREDPLRHTAVAGHEMAGAAEMRVGKDLEHAGKRLAHLIAPRVARPTDFFAGGRLEDAVVRHE